MNSINRIWRFFATAFCFAVFGLGGLILAILWLPAYKLIYLSHRQKQQKASRRAVHLMFKFFVTLMSFVGVVKVEGTNLHQLAKMKGMIVIANHPSLIDVVVMISVIRDANCVVKKSLWHNPFIGGVVRCTGYLSNDDPEQLVEQCRASLSQGSNLIIFPEGTRTKPGSLPVFQRGAANLALRTGKNFQRILLDVTPPGLTKGLPWYKVPKHKMIFSLEVKEEFDVAPFQGVNISKSVRKLTREIQQTFVEEMQHREFTQ